MNIQNTNEPSMDKIDDYYGKESPSKRKTINTIIVSLIVAGIILAIVRITNHNNVGYIGTPEHPGILIQKGH